MSPNPSQILDDLGLPRSALRLQYTRSRGPGGQNVNKLNTKATLTVACEALASFLDVGTMSRLRLVAGRHLTEEHLSVSSDRHRSQLANRRACEEKLCDFLQRASTAPQETEAYPRECIVSRTSVNRQETSLAD